MKITTLLLGLFFLLWVSYREFRRPDLTVIGYVHMADGLGRQSVELIDALKEDVRIDFIPTKEGSFVDVPPAVKKIVSHRRETLGKVVIFEECLWSAYGAFYEKLKEQRRADQLRIAYSMFEATRIPDKWVEILNTYFDAVAVPDPFLIDVYKNSGVTLPIFLLPLGLDLQPFFEEPLKRRAHSPFVFGNLSTCLDRKNHLTLVRAFAKVFGNDESVRLLINSRYGNEKIDSLVKKEIVKLGLTNVLFSHLEFDKASYLKLFKEIDCYVSLSKGEGFSIQPREAMALGIPTIVTDNTGQSTICRSGLATVISSSEKQSAFFDALKMTCGFHFNCTVDEAAWALKEVHDNYEKYLRKASASRKWVRQFTYDEMKPLYKMVVKPKKLVLGDENKVTSSYLMTNSKALYEKFQCLTQ